MLTASFLISFSTVRAAEEKPEILCTSPSGAWQVEQHGDDVWVVSTKDTAQRAKLPPIEAIVPFPDEFHFSPNDEWIFATHHVGSGMQNGDFFHRLSADKIDMLGSFNDEAWGSSVERGVPIPAGC